MKRQKIRALLIGLNCFKNGNTIFSYDGLKNRVETIYSDKNYFNVLTFELCHGKAIKHAFRSLSYQKKDWWAGLGPQLFFWYGIRIDQNIICEGSRVQSYSRYHTQRRALH